jgi:hypothetical protein
MLGDRHDNEERQDLFCSCTSGSWRRLGAAIVACAFLAPAQHDGLLNL